MEFRLPDIGEGLTEAGIVRWLVPVGGVVETDAPLVEVETDKAVVEIPSPFAGTVVAHGAEEGATIRVGEVLAVIGDSSGDSSEVPAAPIVGTLDGTSEQLPTRTDSRATSPVENPAEGRPVEVVRALPVVRKLARELGVDLSAVVGTGSDGKITRDDVRRAAGAGRGGGTEAALDERVTMSRLRRTIAAHMERSWREIPHVTTFDQVDGSRLLATRSALARRHEATIPIETLVILAVLPVLREHPEFNATLDGDGLVLHRRYDVGLAVDTPEGLIVPVVKGADGLDLVALSDEVVRLSAAARERALLPDEVVGATFTVSNIGALGGGFGTPIIPYGTTAILSVGRAVDTPIVRDGAVVVAPMVPLSLSYDHRVVDGGLGRRFMAMLMEHLEEPALFLG